jgi:hypothetical protein
MAQLDIANNHLIQVEDKNEKEITEANEDQTLSNMELKSESNNEEKANIQILSFTEYRAMFPTDRREFWKLYRAKGAIDSRKIEHFGCDSCLTKMFNNKDKIKYMVKEGKLVGVNCNHDLCEECIDRTIYEVNGYIYRLGFRGYKRKADEESKQDKEEKHNK